MLTQSFLHDYFDYVDGCLIWKKTVGKYATKGRVAGTYTNRGYVSIRICGKRYPIHRIIYFYHHGYFPKIVDHIDGNRINNKIENLRSATVSQNAWNSKIRKTNSSGIKGVSWDKRVKKWRASCTVNYKQNNLGYYDSIEDAAKVVSEFRQIHHKEFSRHG